MSGLAHRRQEDDHRVAAAGRLDGGTPRTRPCPGIMTSSSIRSGRGARRCQRAAAVARAGCDGPCRAASDQHLEVDRRVVDDQDRRRVVSAPLRDSSGPGSRLVTIARVQLAQAVEVEFAGQRARCAAERLLARITSASSCASDWRSARRRSPAPRSSAWRASPTLELGHRRLAGASSSGDERRPGGRAASRTALRREPASADSRCTRRRARPRVFRQRRWRSRRSPGLRSARNFAQAAGGLEPVEVGHRRSMRITSGRCSLASSTPPGRRPP